MVPVAPDRNAWRDRPVLPVLGGAAGDLHTIGLVGPGVGRRRRFSLR